jgi:hypothetical protein
MLTPRQLPVTVPRTPSLLENNLQNSLILFLFIELNTLDRATLEALFTASDFTIDHIEIQS